MVALLSLTAVQTARLTTVEAAEAAFNAAQARLSRLVLAARLAVTDDEADAAQDAVVDARCEVAELQAHAVELMERELARDEVQASALDIIRCKEAALLSTMVRAGAIPAEFRTQAERLVEEDARLTEADLNRLQWEFKARFSLPVITAEQIADAEARLRKETDADRWLDTVCRGIAAGRC